MIKAVESKMSLKIYYIFKLMLPRRKIKMFLSNQIFNNNKINLRILN